MVKYGIGQPVRRKEDVRLVTGKGRYTDDIVLENQAYAAFVRSPHAHAVIGNIDTSAAEETPGFIGLVTAKDLNGIGTMPVMVQLKSRDGSPVIPTPKALLASDKVRFCGEAVVVIVAESPGEARDAADRVTIDYEPLEAVPSIEHAPAGALLWDGVPGNLVLDWAEGDAGTSEAVFARAPHTVAVDVMQNRVMPSPMEPRGAIGFYDRAADKFTLYTGTQGGSSVRDRLANVLKHPKDKIRVITPDVGGGFGQKTGIVPEQALVLLAARKFGRPVKWTGDRSEAFLADAHGRDLRMRGELALNSNGHILGLRVTSRANMGAYLSQIGPNVATNGGMRILGGVYRVPSTFAQVKCYVTNTAPLTAYRGAGRPEVAYLVERLLDTASRDLGIDQLEIRRRNLLRPNELPYRNWRGLAIDSGDFARNLDDVASDADWQGFDARKKESAGRGLIRGRGIGYYVEVSGGHAGPEPCSIRFTDDGGVNVIVATQANGQGHETSFAQLVSEWLGVSYERINIIQGDTDYGLSGLNSVGSRSLQTAGNAIRRATGEIVKKGKVAAAHMLQAADAEVTFETIEGVGRFAVSGTSRSITTSELAIAMRREKLPGFDDGLDEAAVYDGSQTFPNGCHVCEVEIDPETGKVAVVRYAVVDDMGRIVNPLIVEGQVHGGVAQGLGQALMENVVYDPESGQLLTASLLDYAIPRAADMPDISQRFNEVLCTTNPLGSKGAGEAGTVGALPAIMGAIADALGVAHFDMPATPERVWRALNQNELAKN